MNRRYWWLSSMAVLFVVACGGNNASPTRSAPATPAAPAAAAPTGPASPAQAAATVAPTPVTVTKAIFQAGFQPQANLPFVAAYVAKEKGYFLQEGLDIEIQHSSGQDAHVQLLAANKIQFSTTVASSILKLRATNSDIPIEAVALFGQRGDTVFAVPADSSIRTPKDFEGKTVGYKVFPSPEYLAMLKSAGADRSKIREVAVGFDPRILVEKKVDVLPVFRSNEPDTLRGLGFPVRTLDPEDYNVPTLGVTYIVNSEWAGKNSAQVTGFLKATMRAVAWIQDHRDEAIDITLKYAPNAQREHQRYMLDIEIEAAQSDLTRKMGIGWMEERQWQAIHDTLIEYKGIEKPVEVKKVFTTRYLAPVYKDGKLVVGP